MARTLVKLRVSLASFNDIRDRIIAAGQPDRVSDRHLNLDGVALELDTDIVMHDPFAGLSPDISELKYYRNGKLIKRIKKNMSKVSS